MKYRLITYRMWDNIAKRYRYNNFFTDKSLDAAVTEIKKTFEPGDLFQAMTFVYDLSKEEYEECIK